MYDPDHNASPFNPVPPAILAVVAVIAVIELAFQAGAHGLAGGAEAVGWRLEALQRFAFFDALWDYQVRSGDWRVDGLWRLVTYSFLHASLTHALFAGVLLLALGNFVSRLFHPAAMLLVIAGASAFGAVAYGTLNDTEVPLYGAYPAVYGLLGMYTWSLFVQAEEMGRSKLTAFRLVAVLVGIQVIFIAIGGRWDSLTAEIAGFVAGFALATPAAPGGLKRLRHRLQGR